MKFLLLAIIIGIISGIIAGSGQVFVLTTASLFVLFIIVSGVLWFIKGILKSVSGFVRDAVRED